MDYGDRFGANPPQAGDQMGKIAVLAFSGGLDTTYATVWLREAGFEVHTITADTGGFDADEKARIERTARSLGVSRHETLDVRAELFTDYLRYLIFANAMRGEVYPLCVAAERVAQARAVANYAAGVGAAALVHGSTGAGNDQVRFDTAFRVIAPDIPVMTPIRDQALSRDQEVQYLAARGVVIPTRVGRYSVNRGLWGATIGGGETHQSDGVLPDDAFVLTAPKSKRPAEAESVSIAFDRGVPVSLDGRGLSPVSLIETLNERAGRFGIGRGMHLGDTILGIKGRVAFEAPAAVVLVAAHRELEKLVLTRQQMTWKRTIGDVYAAGLHKGRYFEPLLRDIEAFLSSSQARVSGEVKVRLADEHATVLGATSPHSMMNARVATYGESSRLWSGAEAAGFTRIYGMQEVLWAAAGKEGS